MYKSKFSGTQIDEALTSVANKADVILVPTKVSQLQNDSGFLKVVPTKLSEFQNDSGFITSAPSKLSELQNDSGFISSVNGKVSELQNDSGFISVEEETTQNVLSVEGSEIVLNSKKSIYLKEINENTVLTINTIELNLTNKAHTFELWLDVKAPSLTITMPEFVWLDSLPNFSEISVYCLTFRIHAWANVANLAYKFTRTIAV